MLRRVISRSLIFSLILVLGLPSVWGQVETGKIIGTVRDPSGAVIPGAEATIIHVGTNRQWTVLTRENGEYVSPPLPIGEYEVVVEMPGFKQSTYRGIILQVQETAEVDIKLEVGDIQEGVEVVGDAPLLNANEVTRGQVIDNQKIVDLPLNGRDYIQLARLSMGTAPPNRAAGMGGFSSSGHRVTQNNYLIDGIDNNNLQTNAQSGRAETIKPSIDAIQEFKIATSNFSAEFGRAAGGVVNLAIKSGTNSFHGTAFGFLRNEALDAKNFFDPPQADKPPFKRSQFGFSLGGPIIEDKTFFFGDYEGTRIRESRTVVATVPTAAMKAGDFSQLPQTIYNPFTYDPATRMRDPFPGNQIPPDLMDPVGVAIANWYPDPQTGSLTQNFVSNPPNQSDINKFDVRLDHNFSPEDKIFYRFSFQRDRTPGSPSLPAPAFGGPEAADTLTNGRNMGLGWTHVFSGTFITSARLGWNRIATENVPPTDQNLNATTGLTGVVDQVTPGGPVLGITTLASLGLGGNANNSVESQARQLIVDNTWLHGNHTLKFGVNFSWLQQGFTNPLNSFGSFDFRGVFTRDPATFNGGHGLADLLLGIPALTRLSTVSVFDGRIPLYHFYVQDDFRVTPRLTLNFGLRYELNLPGVDTQDRVSNFDIDTDPENPVFVLASGDSREGRSTIQLDQNNFAPRIGLAYRLANRTVVRAGYGVYYGNLEGFLVAAGSNLPYFFLVNLNTNNINPAFLLQDGVPNVLTAENVQAVRPVSFDRNPATPYSQQWTLNVQHEFARNWVWEVGYTGNRGVKLAEQWDPNYAPPGPGNPNARRQFRSVPYPGTEMPVFLAQVIRIQNDANTNYHGLQTRVEKRLSEGLSLLASYTWSKTIGDYCAFASSGREGIACVPQDSANRQLERALDNQHVGHIFTGNYIWDLPFGHQKRWGSGWGSVADAILGNWTTAGIITLQTGSPLTPALLQDRANTGGLTRPDLVGDPHLDDRSVSQWFNTAAFALPETFTFGTSGRNILLDPGCPREKLDPCSTVAIDSASTFANTRILSTLQ